MAKDELYRSEHASVMTQEQYLAAGGSQAVVDLVELVDERIVDAINGVIQLVDGNWTEDDPRRALISIHSMASLAAIKYHYLQLCSLKSEVVPWSEFVGHFMASLIASQPPDVTVMAEEVAAMEHDEDTAPRIILRRIR